MEQTDLSMLPSTPAEAKAVGASLYFTGKPCPHGHIAARYASCDACKTCKVRHVEKRKPKKCRTSKDRNKNPEYREWKKKWREANVERIRMCNKKWRAANRDRIRENNRRWQCEQRSEDNAFVLTRRLRCRIAHALRAGRATKSASTLCLAGCTKAELVAHIEAQFLPGMSWENRELWHIDHIIPCASFDLTDPAQQRSCFHYSNLRPLWASENMLKSDGGVEPVGRQGRGELASAFQLCILIP